MKYIGWFILAFFFVFKTGQAQINIQEIRNGDLIFQNGACGDLCKAINSVTASINGKHFSHIGIIEKNEGHIFVIEAIGPEVQKVSLKEFLSKSEDAYLIGRMKKEYQHLIETALIFSNKQLGVPYDWDFIYDNGKYYCSELIYDAFKFANKDQEVFQLVPMTFKAPLSEDFFLGWVKYYEQRNMEIPEGELGCNPGGLGNSDKIEIYELVVE